MNEIKLESVELLPIQKKEKEYNPLLFCCNTYKNLPECENELRKIWNGKYDVLCNEFVCDFYHRKNSGAFRRKCRNFKKEREKEYGIDKGTGMVTGATPEEMKGDN